LIVELTSETPIPEHPNADFSTEKVQSFSSELLVTNYKDKLDKNLLPGGSRRLTLQPNVSIDKNDLGHKSTAAIFSI
jgi:hypothetical protein